MTPAALRATDLGHPRCRDKLERSRSDRRLAAFVDWIKPESETHEANCNHVGDIPGPFDSSIWAAAPNGQPAARLPNPRLTVWDSAEFIRKSLILLLF